ncbi:SRPBCC family protein [Ferruginibacter sp.]
MQNNQFNCSIYADITPAEAFAMISRVSDWWIKTVHGKTSHLHDEFTVAAGTTWKSFKITEFIPDKKIVWLVTDCNLPWNTDIKEWKGTEIVWEISNQHGATRISFSHIGLPELDCGNQCMNAWTGYIQQSLYKLITEGKGLPNKF